ncbi:MAG TPA: signal peptidase I, partial [Deltaproteobacteria bacterium]|nr:signal peptidase I [Deltaproteobacteria bacterium]
MTSGPVQHRTKSVFREYFEAITIALAVALFLRFFVVEAFKIPSGSMVDTLEIGDFIFVNKLAYRTEIPFTALSVPVPLGGTTLKEWRQPERGDIIVFRWPVDPHIDYIKRV